MQDENTINEENTDEDDIDDVCEGIAEMEAVEALSTKDGDISHLIKMTDLIYETVIENSPPMNDERTKTAEALKVLRFFEKNKDYNIEYGIQKAFNESKEAIIKTLIFTVLKNNIRFMDVVFIMDDMVKNAYMLPLWEYDNISVADIILNSVSYSPKDLNDKDSDDSTSDLFKSLGEK